MLFLGEVDGRASPKETKFLQTNSDDYTYDIIYTAVNRNLYQTYSLAIARPHLFLPIPTEFFEFRYYKF